jgi:hypothetical protein
VFVLGSGKRQHRSHQMSRESSRAEERRDVAAMPVMEDQRVEAEAVMKGRRVVAEAVSSGCCRALSATMWKGMPAL